MVLPRRLHPNRKLILAEFEKGQPLTKHDLELRIGIDQRNINHYLKDLKADGLIHISGYVSLTTGEPTRQWSFGDKPDAVLKAKTKAQKAREWRRKNDNGIAQNLKKRKARLAQKLGLPLCAITVQQNGVRV